MSRADDVAAVEAAQGALYAALERADVDAMAALWDDECPDAVLVVHPGLPAVFGRSAVLRSWSAVMAGHDALAVLLSDVRVAVDGDTALVSCVENVLAGGADGGGAGASAATSVWRRRAAGWRLQAHHAGPLLEHP